MGFLGDPTRPAGRRRSPLSSSYLDQYACKKSKHIIRVITMLREWILNLVYVIMYIPGQQNFADLMTKPLSLAPHQGSSLTISSSFIRQKIPVSLRNKMSRKEFLFHCK